MNFDVFIWILEYPPRADDAVSRNNRDDKIGPDGGPDACVKSHQAAKRLCKGPKRKDKTP